jgi:hypothetical protein
MVQTSPSSCNHTNQCTRRHRSSCRQSSSHCRCKPDITHRRPHHVYNPIVFIDFQHEIESLLSIDHHILHQHEYRAAVELHHNEVGRDVGRWHILNVDSYRYHSHTQNASSSTAALEGRDWYGVVDRRDREDADDLHGCCTFGSGGLGEGCCGCCWCWDCWDGGLSEVVCHSLIVSWV